MDVLSDTGSYFSDFEGEFGLSKRLADYEVLGVLGKGEYGTVFKVRFAKTGLIYAMKVMKKTDIAKDKLANRIRLERDILAQVKSPFIVELKYAFETENQLVFGLRL